MIQLEQRLEKKALMERQDIIKTKTEEARSEAK